MRLDRLPIAILTERATLRGETVTFGTSLTKPSSCDQSVARDRLRSGLMARYAGHTTNLAPGGNARSAIIREYRKTAFVRNPIDLDFGSCRMGF